jgi:glycosyltransferase involved in cell wall biosynthesis
MPLTVLNVSYPLAPVGPDAVGGAEQIVFTLDEALTRAGHHSIVVAPEGSSVCGRLVPTRSRSGPFDPLVRALAQRCHAIAIEYVLDHWAVDLVHMHGVDFDRYLPARDVPVAATLHLRLDAFSAAALGGQRPQIRFFCVSETQRRAAAARGVAASVVNNGVSLDPPPHVCKRDFVLALGRICPEKGFHEAIDAARLAHVDLLLAGRTFQYEEHEAYFREQIAPRLDARRQFIGPAGRARKRQLLAEARCLLVPSRVEETSSLVAMEALACGTPVVAYPSGALSEIVEHGRTGFLVHDAQEMADAIRAVSVIDPAGCRAEARRRFSAERMVDGYVAAYADIVRACSWPEAVRA